MWGNFQNVELFSITENEGVFQEKPYYFAKVLLLERNNETNSKLELGFNREEDVKSLKKYQGKMIDISLNIENGQKTTLKVVGLPIIKEKIK